MRIAVGVTFALILGGVVAEIQWPRFSNWTTGHPFITSPGASLLVLALGYSLIERLLDHRRTRDEQAL